MYLFRVKEVRNCNSHLRVSERVNYSYLSNSLPYKDELDKAFPETRNILDMFLYGNTFPVLTQKCYHKVISHHINFLNYFRLCNRPTTPLHITSIAQFPEDPSEMDVLSTHKQWPCELAEEQLKITWIYSVVPPLSETGCSPFILALGTNSETLSQPSVTVFA